MIHAEKHQAHTVKLVYKDHPRDQQNVVLIHVIHRWSLYAGSVPWKVYPCGPECGLYQQVVFTFYILGTVDL